MSKKYFESRKTGKVNKITGLVATDFRWSIKPYLNLVKIMSIISEVKDMGQMSPIKKLCALEILAPAGGSYQERILSVDIFLLTII